jgi:TetR/AcrR family transcriptional regulator
MVSKFLSLDPEKQNRIINAALNEFAGKGYDNASTNEIVKEAGISKGLLFHYFRNKKELFLFLYDHCVEVTMEDFYKKIDLNETDFFARMHQFKTIKWNLIKQYPEIFKFLEASYLETAHDVKDDLDKRNKELHQDSTSKIFNGLDTAKFKDGIDVQKAINIVLWTFQGLADEALERAKLTSSNQVDYEQAFSEADDYIEMFRSCFYK